MVYVVLVLAGTFLFVVPVIHESVLASIPIPGCAARFGCVGLRSINVTASVGFYALGVGAVDAQVPCGSGTFVVHTVFGSCGTNYSWQWSN